MKADEITQAFMVLALICILATIAGQAGQILNTVASGILGWLAKSATSSP